ncbi:MAG TPA: Ig-like domain-containing protein [Candidatus Krumholzibacterium sp.]|nr:Ig-like domain-containing protein [Candidatus Krumholzibacterium sp.]
MKGFRRIVILSLLAVAACRAIAGAAPLTPSGAPYDPDVEPPFITGIEVQSDWVIEMIFSEQLSSGPAEDRNNYSIYAGDGSRMSVDLAEYMPSTRSVYIVLKYALRQKESYRAVCRGIADQAGNVMAYGEIDFVAIDRTPPWILSAVTLDSLNVAVVFDEEVDPVTSVRIENYTVFETEDADRTVPVARVTRLSPEKVWISLSARMQTGTSYSLRALGVEDAAGVPIPPPGMVKKISFPDDTPPYVSLVRQVLACVPVRLEILFNEAVDPGSVAEICNYCLFRTGEPSDPVPLSCFISNTGEGRWVYLALGGLLEDGQDYTLALARVKDLAGNCVPVGYEFTFRTDRSPPPFYSTEYRTALREVEICWSLAAGSETPGFTVLRAPGGTEDFQPLPDAGLRIDGLDYSYVDGTVEYGGSYAYRVEYLYGDGLRVLFGTGGISTPGLAFLLRQNCPNPFNPGTSISWQQPEEGPVLLEVYDVSGRRVAVVERGYRYAGDHHVQWDGSGPGGERLGSGVYFYRLVFGSEVRTRKMVLLR